MRYFAGADLQGARQVMVQLYGDRDGALRLAPDEIRNNTRQAQENYAREQARKTGIPFVVLARPGTYGSTGDHRQRRTVAEFEAISAALDELKRRYGIRRFVLIGHSGGATAIAALMTRGRTDIACAVMSSGAYQYLARAILWRLRRDRSLAFDDAARRIAEKYDPIDHMDAIEKDAGRKVYILGDPRDSKTPFHLQVLFAWEMQRRGHHAQVVSVAGKPPDYHNLEAGRALSTATACARPD